MPSDHWESTAILIFGAIGIASVFRWRVHAKGTTLTSVVCWTTISLISLVGTEVFCLASSRAGSDSLVIALRFAAAVSTFCPFVARLGAKRPQHKAWHFVVFTLWLVLASPAAESVVLRPGQMLDVDGARSWFLAVLILVGLFDRILTRFAGTALLAASGQSLLLAAYLPLPTAVAEHTQVYWLGVALITLSVLFESFRLPRRNVDTLGMDALWLDFRDDFGTLWGIRVIERLNAAAELNGWDVRLGWSGFRRPDSAQHEELPEAFVVALRNLLRRFVGPEWIASRIGKHIDC
jgi:hypothetical protein